MSSKKYNTHVHSYKYGRKKNVCWSGDARVMSWNITCTNKLTYRFQSIFICWNHKNCEMIFIGHSTVDILGIENLQKNDYEVLGTLCNHKINGFRPQPHYMHYKSLPSNFWPEFVPRSFSSRSKVLWKLGHPNLRSQPNLINMSGHWQKYLL